MSVTRIFDITLSLLLTLTLGGELVAQVITIPDSEIAASEAASPVSQLDQRAKLSVSRVPLHSALSSLQVRSGVSLVFSPSRLPSSLVVTCECYDATVGEALAVLLDGTKMRYSVIDRHILIEPEPAEEIRPADLRREGRLALEGGIRERLQSRLMVPAIPQQQGTVTGIVRAVGTNAPLSGVMVSIEGTGLGAMTTESGRYRIENVPAGRYRVTASSIGYQQVTDELEVRSGEVTNLDFRLETSPFSMDEIVVVGYGTESRARLSGNVTSVQGEELQTAQTLSILETLNGRIPGLLVKENFASPGGAPELMIHGVGSISSSTAPLIIVDGVIYSAGRNPPNLAMTDIESISILKDAASTAVYGSRGANGVVIITTKRGEAGPVSTEYTVRMGLSDPDLSMRRGLMSLEQKLEYERQLGLYDSSNPTTDAALKELFLARSAATPTVWADELIEQGNTQEHNFRVSGGTDRITFSTSLNFAHEATLYDSRYRKLAGLANLDFQVSDRIDAQLNLHYSQSNLADLRTTFSPISNAFQLNPYVSGYDELGEIPILLSTGEENPFALKRYSDAENESHLLSGSIGVGYQIMTGLRATSRLSIDRRNGANHDYKGIRLGQGGSLTLRQTEGQQYNFTNTLTFDRHLADAHHLSATAGFEAGESEGQQVFLAGRGFQSDAVKTITAASVVSKPSHTKDIDGFVSQFARATYSYQNLYNLTASFRRDGSSKFGDNNKYANFWAVGASWNISNEEFFGLSFIDVLKLRGTIGTSGNDFISPFAYRALYSLNRQYNDETAATLLRLDNPNLTWEQHFNTNLGLDIGLFGGRADLRADIYRRVTTDLLVSMPTPLQSGFESMTSNIGQISNRGVEIELNTLNLSGPSFRWTTRANLTLNRNNVDKLYSGGKPILYGSSIYEEGSPARSLYLIPWEGVDPETGENMYRDRDGNPLDESIGNFLLGEERQVLYNAIPTYHGGVENHLTMGSLDARVLFTYSGGNHVVNSLLHRLYNSPRENQDVAVLNAWQKPGDQATIARRDLNTTDYEYSSRYVQDGGYIKLKSVQLGYNLSPEMAARVGASRLRIFAQAQNLYSWSEISYVDPEYATLGGGIGASSPIVRKFGLGMDLTF